ncbi:hypothetical protein [Denitromonas sp.]|uniref:hypothetical protein n=1 Tax=Denitromonas sp. TaxID=2734609 RepID=UPI002AFF1D7C|nr:hypothetical protein [Denitromonas sp.]
MKSTLEPAPFSIKRKIAVCLLTPLAYIFASAGTVAFIFVCHTVFQCALPDGSWAGAAEANIFVLTLPAVAAWGMVSAILTTRRMRTFMKAWTVSGLFLYGAFFNYVISQQHYCR